MVNFFHPSLSTSEIKSSPHSLENSGEKNNNKKGSDENSNDLNTNFDEF